MATNFKLVDNGIYYLFDKAGEGIAMHAHVTSNLWHDTQVLKGCVEVYGDGIDLVGKAGSILKYKSYRMHEIVALEDGTEIINTCLEGTPYVGENDSGSIVPELLGRIAYG